MYYKLTIVFITFLISGVVMADQNLKLIVSQDSDLLRVEIQNLSYSNVLINKRFALGINESKHSEISILFKNENNEEFRFSSKLKIRPPNKSDLCLLSPGMYIGRLFKLTDLVDYFDLKQNKYDVKVIYQNSSLKEKDVFIGKLESDWSNIIIK